MGVSRRKVVALLRDGPAIALGLIGFLVVFADVFIGDVRRHGWREAIRMMKHDVMTWSDT